MPYAELQVTSNYSFLRGASHVEELLLQAHALGLAALAITDRNSLAGIARAHQRAGEAEMRLVVGCRLDLADGVSLLAYPTSRAAYAKLCRFLTWAKRGGKGTFAATWDDLLHHDAGLIAVLLTEEPASARLEPQLEQRLGRLRAHFGDRAYLALTPRRQPGDAARLARLADAAAAARIATVATGDVLYHHPQRRELQDVLTCIREGCTIDAAGFRLEEHADRHLRPPEEIERRMARYPEAVARTLEIAERCRFSLSELRYQYPNEVRIPGQTPQQALEALVWEAAPHRYPEGVTEAVSAQLRHELRLIAELDYAPYFLTVHSIVRYANGRGILCQGRGSAANSAVCYVIGITAIDPTRGGLLFERFVSAARREPPDIDVDFEHERREEVIQWVYEHYGRDRAALCATVIRYRSRGAIREVGKTLGLPEDVTAALASQVWGWSEDGVESEHAKQLNLNLEDRRLRLALDLARQLIGFPRHLGTHPGGFVLTEARLDDLVPIEPAAMEDRHVIEWDKDDIDVLRWMKVDVLGLGMLGCMRRAFDLLDAHRGERLSIATIPAEDPATYEMIRHADTLGVFQIESRAQMSMLPRLKPRTFYDLVIEVAVVRPGPIQGDMVHPYLRRREGIEPVDYPTPELAKVLGKTLGVPLFQEQAMQVAMVCAGFSADEADALRRSMATFRFTGGVSHFQERLIAGMITRGYTPEFAGKLFKQIEGFGSYGFPESHAASFALIAYASSWMKCHHPDVFCCALLNAQPMGFYAPAQIVRDAREHGVCVRPVSVQHSQWDSTLEACDGRYLAVRLGLRMAKGLAEAHGAAIVAARSTGNYADVADVWRRSRAPAAALERVAEADGFAALGLDRRQALWVIRGLRDAPLPLFDDAASAVEPAVPLRPMTEGREVVEDYGSTGLTLRAHPVSFLRRDLARAGMLPCAALAGTRDGRRVTVAGIVLVRQKPGSAKGVLFMTIEDETGIANLVIWPSLFEQQRRLILSAGMVGCHGKVQREDEVIHVVAEHLMDQSALLRSVGERRDPFPLVQGRGDEAKHGGSPDHRDPARLGRKPRDIFVPDLRLGSGIPRGGTPPKGIRVATRDFR